MFHRPDSKTIMHGASAVAVVALLGILWAGWRGDRGPETVPVARSSISEEILASGSVEAPSQLDLHFRDTARLAVRLVSVGDDVATGAVLAEQSVAQLDAQLREMQAGVDIQRARLAQLSAGSSPEDIRLAETAVRTAEQSLANAHTALAEALRDAYTKLDDAIRTKADTVFMNGRSGYPKLQFTTSNLSQQSAAEEQRLAAEKTLTAWSMLNLDDAQALRQATPELQRDFQNLATFLDTLSGALNGHVTGFTATALDSAKTAISSARTSVNAAALTVTTAYDALQKAEGALAAARDTLAQRAAAARPTDLALAEAQVRQAEAAMERIRVEKAERQLVAPFSGVITDVQGEPGEIVGPGVAVVSMMPNGGLQITVDVSEHNILNVEPGQRARITLDAFGPAKEWIGTVVRVNPVGEVIGGAVYYPTTILFETVEARIRPGMTANVWIETITRPDALVVPAGALFMRNGEPHVRVLRDGTIVEQAVVRGITGTDGYVEIIAGVEEGERIVTSLDL